MSERIENTILICEEEESICELCGKIAELRPYGKNGENICFSCGMKDEKTTREKCLEKLFDIPIN